MSLQFTTPTSLGQGLVSRSTSIGFSAVPHSITSDLRLKAVDIRLVAVPLLRYSRAKATCYPCNATLARDIGMSVRTVQYALARLIAAGWVNAWTELADGYRVLCLTWRVKPPTPVLPYTQGMPRANRIAHPPTQEKPADPMQAVASKLEGGEKKEVRLAPLKRADPEIPMSYDEVVAMHTATGWLQMPLSDARRQIAERSLARSLEAARGVPGQGGASRPN